MADRDGVLVAKFAHENERGVVNPHVKFPMSLLRKYFSAKMTRIHSLILLVKIDDVHISLLDGIRSIRTFIWQITKTFCTESKIYVFQNFNFT